MDDLISKLSEIRSDYNCFIADEEPYYRALSEAIRILAKRVDGDTISRQAAIDCVTYDVEHTIECLKALPSAQPEQKTGHWINSYKRQTCSICKQRGYRSWNFCPNCGADMRGGQE